MIKSDRTEIMGWFEWELMQAWRNPFPLTELSRKTGFLPITNEAWSSTPNPWWRFLMDRPTIPTNTLVQSGGTVLVRTNQAEMGILNHAVTIFPEEVRSKQVLMERWRWRVMGNHSADELFDRCIMWENLKKVSDRHDLPWILMGDFNEVLEESEKFGGNSLSVKKVREYRECMDQCNLLDLGFSGPKYT
ncbi:hypothetical protein SO802_003526 [Lithocarpus litseifolius]|uniref:Exo_endo_phos domain-containing protein n=1 Tax=Lithocarpus litseifolius TaxID=425828 RepID=A0AAW2E2Z3_9ROSI